MAKLRQSHRQIQRLAQTPQTFLSIASRRFNTSDHGNKRQKLSESPGQQNNAPAIKYSYTESATAAHAFSREYKGTTKLIGSDIKIRYSGHRASESDSQKKRIKTPSVSSRTPKAKVDETAPTTPEVKHKQPKAKEPWMIQKAALEKKFADQKWEPRKKLSPDTMAGIRELNASEPQRWSTENLAQEFEVSPEAIRRILKKSAWKPTPEEDQKRRERWARRHDRIWDMKAELGLLPPRKGQMDVTPSDEGAEQFDEMIHQKRMLGQI